MGIVLEVSSKRECDESMVSPLNAAPDPTPCDYLCLSVANDDSLICYLCFQTSKKPVGLHESKLQ